MGTNFYFVSENGLERHIGKRSAAGMFCWDCGLSLCAAGHAEIHHSEARWLKECPVCGKATKQEELENSTAGRELGFNHEYPKRKKGIASCCSFTWAISPGHFAGLKIAPNLHIEDEYEREYTLEEFSATLSECPIMFFDSIGVDFS